jgi:hypothetical protein
VDGGPFQTPLPDYFRGTTSRYRRAVVDLPGAAGRSIQLRFELSSPVGTWEIDDFRISGPPSNLRALERGGDLDGDGIPNGEELTAGTDPASADTDGDGLADGLEVAGGTDPRNLDTDGAGMADGEEAFLGLDPSGGSDDFEAGTLTASRRDGEGFEWVISDGGWIDDFSPRGFERAMQLWIGGQPFPMEREARFDPKGEVILIGPVEMGALDVTRQVFVPSSQGAFIRYIEVLENPGRAEVKSIVRIAGEFGADRSTNVLLTSNGDRLFTAADGWVAVGSSSTTSSTLPSSVVNAGERGRVRPIDASLHVDEYVFEYEVVVPAGGRVAVMHFASKSVEPRGAVTSARSLVGLAGRAEEGLKSPLGRSILNFSLDADRDGIPDDVETANGLDPDDPGDAVGDLDGDGLSNLAEFRSGAGMRKSDTDGDGLDDRTEVEDLESDPTKADSDGDGRDDPQDPFPGALILARLRLPSAAIVGLPSVIRLEVSAREEPVRVPIPLTLRVSEGAVFAGEALEGRLVSGGGTAEAELESRDGRITIEVTPTKSGSLVFTLDDPQAYGILFRSEVFEDFETSNGDFIHGGEQDEWEWGVPSSGPGVAHSGNKVWATDLDGNYNHLSDQFLETPAYLLPPVPGLKLEFWQWIAVTSCCDEGKLLVSAGESPFEEALDLDLFRGTSAGFERVALGLDAYAGKLVKFRFRLISDASGNNAGLYIDDFRIHGPPLDLQLVDPDFGKAKMLLALEGPEDLDEDGLSNEDEVSRGTRPLVSDTDGGGLSDGDEVAQGLDPLDSSDDSGPRPFIRGDSDANDALELTDAVVLLDYLFRRGPRPPSLDASDADDSGRLNVTDAVYLLLHLFRGGQPPPPPYPEPGQDPTPDNLAN